MKLRPCPSSPNCVCSTAEANDPVHFIAPLTFSASGLEVWKHLHAILLATRGMKVTKKDAKMIQAEHRSRIFGFIDDLEFHLLPSGPGGCGIIHVRSASRVGHSDLGANRKRIESIRLKLARALQ